MHTVQILLDTKRCSMEMEKRFRAMTHIHNVCVKHGNRLLDRLSKNKKYQDDVTRYHEVSVKLGRLAKAVPVGRKERKEQQERVKALEAERKFLKDRMNQTRKDMGLTKSGLNPG